MIVYLSVRAPSACVRVNVPVSARKRVYVRVREHERVCVRACVCACVHVCVLAVTCMSPYNNSFT